MTDRQARSIAEWVSLALSSVVVAVILALVLVQLSGTDRPPSPRVSVEAVDPVGDRFQVVAVVTNAGDRTAANVQVSASLTTAGSTRTADQLIDFLSGGEEHRLTFVFDRNPASGDLQIAITGFSEP